MVTSHKIPRFQLEAEQSEQGMFCSQLVFYTSPDIPYAALAWEHII